MGARSPIDRGIVLGMRWLTSILACSLLLFPACADDEGTGDGGDGDTSGGDGDGDGDDPNDPYSAERSACIAKINELRATKGLSPYSRWKGAEECADDQATMDEQAKDPHGSFGMCGESAQNECLGGGAAGIESCLESMWAEKDLAGCAGCDACADAYSPDCPNCDFYGDKTGDVCGHYVNMSAKYFSQAACGFGTGWATIDFK